MQAADPADSEVAARRTQIVERGSQGLAQDVYDLFSQALQSEAGVTIDTTALNAVNAQMQ